MSDLNSLAYIYSFFRHQLHSKSDVIVVVAHWYLTKYARFRICNSGDPSIDGTSAFPIGWNQNILNDPAYEIRYSRDDQEYVLSGHIVGDDIYLRLRSLNRAHDLTTVKFNINKTVRGIIGEFLELVPDARNVVNVIEQNLVNPIVPRAFSELPRPNYYNWGWLERIKGVFWNTHKKME